MTNVTGGRKSSCVCASNKYNNLMWGNQHGNELNVVENTFLSEIRTFPIPYVNLKQIYVLPFSFPWGNLHRLFEALRVFCDVYTDLLTTYPECVRCRDAAAGSGNHFLQSRKLVFHSLARDQLWYSSQYQCRKFLLNTEIGIKLLFSMTEAKQAC